jgi:hypothetical protein
MEEWLARFVQDFSGRLTGPLHFRFLLQPVMASILAIRAGMQDARARKPPYFWAIFMEPGKRKQLMREGWQAIAKVFTIAVIMDVIYQLIALRWVYLLDTLVTAMLLAIVPYLFLRGPVNRIAQAWKRHAEPPENVRGAK